MRSRTCLMLLASAVALGSVAAAGIGRATVDAYAAGAPVKSKLLKPGTNTAAILPAVTSISPNSGPVGGGTTVSITGSGLTGATAVYFGTVRTTITANTDTQVTVTSPPELAPIAVDVTVTTPSGASAVTSADQFTYVATYGKASTLQYRLADSDGVTWMDMDANGNLTLVIAPGTNSTAVIGGNSDLWTKNAGYNQDIGINVNGAIVAWKESGGFAGTFSPNAAYVQTVVALTAGTTYTVKLQWKTNKPAAGATIFAGAGPIDNQFSPTRLVAQVFPTVGDVVRTAISTQQYKLANSDGVTWVDLDPSALVLTLTPTSNMNVILSANADLWTKNAGYNQDIGIDVNGTIVAWKESGGFAGTFSPNAAYVIAAQPLTAGITYTIKLRWKSNKPASGATIFVGAGPIAGQFSPTRVTAQLSPTNADATQAAVSTQQYRLANSDGVSWVDMDSSNLTLTFSPKSNMMVVIGGNSDLWTKNAGYNQDIGININGALVAWKESGGYAGTFSPNAAYVQTVVSLAAGTIYTVKLQWKTNKPAPGATIFAGAGPISGVFSPTTLTMQLPGSLAFDDEFNGTALDSNGWVALNRPGDASNNELECYKPANAAVANGSLVLTTQVDSSCSGYNYTSAYVQWGSYNFLYGTIEVRAKLAGGQGPWPAVWLLGANCQQTNIASADNVPPCNWPTPGSDEIDIAEALNGNHVSVNQQIHSTLGNPGCDPTTTDVSQNWHTYDLVWKPGSLTWQIDGVTTCSVTQAVPTNPMFLNLNTAVGGVGGGTVNNATLPQTHSIDYVRVFQPQLPPAVVATSPAANAVGAATTGPVTAMFSKAITQSSIQFTLTGPNNAAVPGAVSYDGATFTASFTPTAALAASTSYAATVSGATDAAGNAMSAPNSWSFTTAACCSLFSPNATPGTVTINDPSAAELGMKFTADVNGSVNALRFYKGPSNTGTHIGNLWTSSGQLLATATFTNESTSGWQQVNLATPVNISAGTIYVVSYHTSVGYYSGDSGGFNSAIDNPPLHGVANSVNANGVYVYGASQFPTQTFTATNYWVDVVFSTSQVATPPSVVGTAPSANATGAALSGPVSATFNESVVQSSIQFALTGPNNASVAGTLTYTDTTHTASLQPSAPLTTGTTYTATLSGATDTGGHPMAAPASWSFTTLTLPAVVSTSPTATAAGIGLTSPVSATFSESVVQPSIQFALTGPNNAAVAGTLSYADTSHTASFQPSAPLALGTAYTATVSGATDAAGNPMSAPFSWSFATLNCPCSLFAVSAIPGMVSSNDGSAVELGMKFTVDVNGTVSAVRFYKGSSNTGTHIGSLWTSSGQLLATATFTNESASGWQQVSFATPVPISAGTTYVVSYHTDVGFYSADANTFTTAIDNAPLHGVANSVSANGVYVYGASQFPTQTFNATNYWVDVVFSAS